jgi:hypothetical protein
MKTLIAIFIIYCNLPFNAFSNDGIAGFKGGKIELNFNSNIAVSIKSEILKVSQTKVDVDYIFYNDSMKDEEILIAFPFPEIDCSDFRFDLNNEFGATINGIPASLNEEITITSKGKDITDQVKKLGLKLCRDESFELEMIANIKVNITNPEKFKFSDSCDEVIYYSNDKNILDKYIQVCKLGYSGDVDGSGGIGFPWGPNWNLSKKTYFKVNFPSMKETRIQHSYVPWTGSGSYGPKGLGYKKYQKIRKLPVWSIGVHEINKNPLRYEMEISGDRYSVEYILKTAKTWKGPIKNFKLIIDRGNGIGVSNYIKDYKLEEDNLVWTAENFIPKEDLVVSFSKYIYVEKKFTGSVSKEEKREFAKLIKEYDAIDSKNKISAQSVVKRFKNYIEKYNKSKNLPQAFSMLDHLENGLE